MLRSALRQVAGLLLILLLCLTTGTAFAAPLPGSGFDSGDGDQADTVGRDWQGAVADGRVKESPDANDDCFVGGVKELTPNQWAFNRSAGGCTPGKSNLRVAYANPETAASTTFGHFAFVRNDTTGNSFLTFELNQAARSWTNATQTTIPCRSDGDVLLSFEVGGSSLTTSLYKWRGDGSGPAACPNGANGTFTGSGPIPAGRFQGAMNAASGIANFVNPAAYGGLFPANAFGEAAIDLPAVLQAMGHSPCFGFLQMQVHSRSSSSISSAMIDYTTPVPVHLQSCAATGTQYQDSNGNGTRDGGEPGLAGFRLYADLDDDAVHDPGEPSGVSDADGSYRILGVPAGSVRIRQEARPGWRCSQPSPCSYSRSLTLGGNTTGNDFGSLGPSTAGGTIFDDLDADGARDADEPGLGGVRLYADLDDDGVPDAGEPASTSGDEGAWSVEGIPAGTARIRPVTPASWTCSAPTPCATAPLSFTSGSAVTGLVFGVYGQATLGGRVFEDTDGDGGAFGAGDVALAGRQVFLDANGSDAFDLGEPQTTTDASGLYRLPGLVPGAATVRVTLPSAAWSCTRPALTPAACETTQTLVSAQTAAGRDFGLTRAATVSGTTWDDVDGDGLRESGDNGLAGFSVFVDYDADNTLDAGEPAATSTTGGAYTITGVRPGSWTLRQLPNGAYACTQPSPCTYAVVLATNGMATARDFGNFVSRSVSGTVFDDADADALVPEAGEGGLAGWVVYSDANSDGVLTAGEPRATTNSLGQYTLTGLANGNYRVRIVGQAGWTCSAPAGCANTGSIGSGQSDTAKHFGVWGPATISGTAFEDADADGAARESGEPGLAGRVVYLDKDGSGSLTAGEPSATTASDGAYAISGVNPGTYTVRQVLPSGATCSRPAPCSYAVTTSSGGLRARDFASYTPGAITGSVRSDADADGAAPEQGDAGLAGRTLFLDGDADGSLDAGERTATTDADGAYAFDGLAPATYTVRQVLPGGWTQSAPAAGHTETVTSGAVRAGRDFAAWTTGTITGTLFEDADFDGAARETGDRPLAGRGVFLDVDDDRVKDAGEPEATSDAGGAYAFTGLRPGEHVVRAVMPAGWACAHPAACAARATITSGATHAGADFGAYVGASLSGTVFEDADAGGQAREDGEAGVAGRRVFLDGDGDGQRQADEPSTLTGADGGYAFNGLTAQAWAVRVEPAAGSVCDRPAPCRHDVVLSSGAEHTGKDFGVHASAAIAGHLFTDRDADGSAQTYGENDQPERTVFLDADGDGTRDGGEAAVDTDDRGDFRFAGLQPGTYRVRQVLPEGWTCSSPVPCEHVVTVRSGQTAGGHTFSSWSTAAFTGTYFEDEDADGEYPEPGDGGVGGRTVFLDADGDGVHDADERATTTATDGRYAFTGLRPGAYAVRSAGQPAGWACSYPDPCSTDLTLEAAEHAQDVDFGAWTAGTVSGTVSRTADGAGLAGWTVFADLDGNGAKDAGEPAATTSTAGAYALTLDPGTYAIRRVAPAGWSCTTPDPCVRPVTVTSSGAVAGQDFGGAQSAMAAGRVYEDADADGTRDDGEPGRGGLEVFVDADDDGAPDAGEPATATQADGGWELPVAAGTHVVRLTLPAGHRCGAPATCARTATVAGGASAADLDFGVWRPASVAGTLSEDTDGDGTRDPGEPAIAGRAIYVDADDDGVRDEDEPSAVTGADGTYTIDGLRPGAHRVRPELATGWRCAGAASCAAPVSLASGAAAVRDIAAWQAGSVGGSVFHDADADAAAWETGEPGLAGRTVYLDTDGDGAKDDGEPSTLSDADGAWSIGELAPGTYTARVVLPQGWSCLRPAPCATSRTTTSGARTAMADFGVAAVAADLAVSLRREPAGLVAGRRASWTASVANAGPMAAPASTLTVTLPAGLGDVTWTAPDGATCTRTGAELTCALGDLATGATAEVTLEGLVAASHAGRELALRAVAASQVADPRPANDAADDAPVPAAVADLRATAALPRTADVGALVDLDLTVANDGPSDATDVVVTAELPEGLTAAVADLPAGCAIAGRTITCTAAVLAVGEKAGRRIPVRVGPQAAGRDLAVPVRATSAADDPTPADAVAEIDLHVDPSADVHVRVSDAPHESPGGVEYGLTVGNKGPSQATGVVLVDGPFEGADVVSVTTTQGTCEVLADRRIRCELGDLAVGEEIVVSVVLVPTPGTDLASIEPGPRADARESDPTPEDNAQQMTLPSRSAATPQAPEPIREPAPDPAPAPPRAPAAAISPLVVEGPSTVRCASLRAFAVKVRRRGGVRLTSVRMWLAGRPLRVTRRHGRFTARVDLRRRAHGTYRLVIRGVEARGRVLRGVRTYHTCTPKRPRSVPDL